MLVRNPQAPRGLFTGIAFDGSMAGEYRGSTYYHDASGLGRHGTLVNYASPTDAWKWSEYLNQHCIFHIDTTTGYDILIDPWVMPSLDECTMGLWYWNQPGGAIVQQIMRASYTGATQYELHGFLKVAITPRFYTNNGTVKYLTGVPMSSNTWYSLIGTFKGGVATMYQNGVQVRQTDHTGTLADYSLLRFGSRAGTATDSGNGCTASPFFFNRAIDLAEITWLAQPQNKLWVPWRRTVWPVVSAAATFNPAWARNCNNLIGAGI